MPRKSPILNEDKDLIGRIFFLLGAKKDTDIAELVGKGRTTIAGWRSGANRPTIDDLRKIIRATGASWDELLSGKAPTATLISTPQTKGASHFAKHLRLLAEYEEMALELGGDFYTAWQGLLAQEGSKIQASLDVLKSARARLTARTPEEKAG